MIVCRDEISHTRQLKLNHYRSPPYQDFDPYSGLARFIQTMLAAAGFLGGVTPHGTRKRKQWS